MNTTAIATNMNSVRTTNIFNKNQANATSAFNKVSTGLKIQGVGDNPTDWAVSEKMRERINSLNQANQNIQNDTAMMKTADGVISNNIDILRTIRARFVESGDAWTSDTDKVNLAKEVVGLLNQIDYNAFNVKYNGVSLLVPDATNNFGNLAFQIGDESGGIMSGITLPDMSVSGLGLTGLANAAYTAAGLGDTYPARERDTTTAANEALAAFSRSSLEAAGADETLAALTYTSVDNVIDSLDTVIEKALGYATDVGALEQRLGYTADNVATQIENLQASDSAIRDADMAQSISDYMKWNVLSQASQYMLAQSNQNAYSVLNLLQ